MWIIPVVILVVIIAVSVFYRHISTRYEVQCSPDSGSDYVVLLHGIGGFSYSMIPLAKELRDKGYTVINVNYPSTKHNIPTIAETYLDSVINSYCIDKDRKVHFVTHSMGGIVTRYYLKHHRDNINLGRVVMLSPPNQGSEIIDVCNSNRLMEPFYGPAFYQLGTDSAGFIQSLGPVDYETGVIIGNKAVFFPGAMIIADECDGMVSVKRASVEGMTDFKVTDDSHSVIMMSKKIVAEVVCFIKSGKFS